MINIMYTKTGASGNHTDHLHAFNKIELICPIFLIVAQIIQYSRSGDELGPIKKGGGNGRSSRALDFTMMICN